MGLARGQGILPLASLCYKGQEKQRLGEIMQYCIVEDDEDANGPWVFGPFPTQVAAYNEIKTRALDWLQDYNNNLSEGQEPYVLDDEYGGEHIEVKDDCDDGKVWWSVKVLNPPNFQAGDNETV